IKQINSFTKASTTQVPDFEDCISIAEPQPNLSYRSFLIASVFRSDKISSVFHIYNESHEYEIINVMARWH
ncbi:MAG: hypothetical protein PUP91_18940, partial [Rhizonema sp. PD37]|nr:hypothetical protein [Rhizonema sp. PD37]